MATTRYVASHIRYKCVGHTLDFDTTNLSLAILEHHDQKRCDAKVQLWMLTFVQFLWTATTCQPR